MSGHSKWSKIKRKKGANDVKRGKILSKLAREITVAARQGGGDPDGNPRLRTVLITARSQNMPSDNVERAIKKGLGAGEGETYDEVRYEGYGPNGVAMIIDTLTDNRNRTVSEVRHVLTKNGGALAEAGAVTWNFSQKGSITIEKSKCSEDELFEKAVEAGAEDVKTDGDYYAVMTEPQDLHAVAATLESAGIEAEEVQLTMIPKTTIEVTGKDAATVLRIMESLEDLDDVQNVSSNFDITEEEMAAAMA